MQNQINLNKDAIIKNLEEQLNAYKDDRYCPHGCVEYQLDKISRFKEYFGEIREGLIILKSMYPNELRNKVKLESIQYMIEICNAALNGSKWV